jgi:hypothetical protein
VFLNIYKVQIFSGQTHPVFLFVKDIFKALNVSLKNGCVRLKESGLGIVFSCKAGVRLLVKAENSEGWKKKYMTRNIIPCIPHQTLLGWLTLR